MAGEWKSIFSSVTVWGAVLAGLSPWFAKLGLAVDPSMAPEMVGITQAAMAAIGGALAIYGRMRADKRVSLTGAAPK